jgi:hypothetical protein
MKRLFLYSIIIVLIITSNAVCAAEKAPLGIGNLAVKLDYITFTDDFWGDLDDDGLYIGIEGYGQIMPNLYLGGEIGQGANIELLGDSISFVPVELNVKYATEVTPNVVIDFGAGLSYSYTEIDFSFLSTRIDGDDWLFGGQIFVDLTYKIKWFSIGVNGKYQITENFKDEDLDLNNLRAGVQIGILF